MCDQVDPAGQAGAIVLTGEVRRHRIADPAHPGIGEEALGAASGGDEDLPRTGPVILQGHEQHRDARVLGRIAGFAFGADAPLAPDLEGYVRGGTVVDIGERHHGDLAPRLLA